MLTALFVVLVAAANSAQPINIEARQFEMLMAERKAVYTGDVHVTQGDYTINADELVVFFDENNQITVMEATGSPATLTDQVRQPSLLITGDELDYLFVLDELDNIVPQLIDAKKANMESAETSGKSIEV